MKKVLVKYHNTDLIPLQRIKKGDWIDLRVGRTVTIAPHTTGKVSFEVSMQLPKGYEAHILPRSSTFKRTRCIQTNGVGIVDNSYCGNNDIWFVEMYNVSDIPATFLFNDRVSQFRIVKKQPRLNIKRVMYLFNANRGGHGSTGVK